MTMTKRGWTSFRLWRSTGTVFFANWPYVCVNYLRNWSYDLLALVPVAAGGIWWAARAATGALPPAADIVALSDTSTYVAYDMVRYLPLAVAVVAALAVLRYGRQGASPAALRQERVAARPIGRVSLAVIVGIAGVDLYFAPGGVAHRFGPVVAATAWAFVVRRRIYGRTPLWVATRAGYRPPPRALISPQDRAIIRRCLSTGSPDTGERPTTGVALTAWCRATAVEREVSDNALREAEQRLTATAADAEVAAHPAVLAARGQYRMAVGRAGDALDDFAAAAGRGRPPARLRGLVSEAEAMAARRPAAAWRGWTRVALVWNRQFAAVMFDVLRHAHGIAETRPALADALALRMVTLAGMLDRPRVRADLSLAEWRAVTLASATAMELSGRLLTRDRRFADAAGTFRAATLAYEGCGDRSRAAAARALAATNALRLEPHTAGRERRLLDALQHGLADLEDDRGGLRDKTSRLALLRARREITDEALEVLAERVTYRRRQAAELALWLLESTRRNALADAIRQGVRVTDAPDLSTVLDEHEAAEAQAWATDTATAAAQLPRGPWRAPEHLVAIRARVSERFSSAFAEALLPDQVDVTDLRRRVGGGAALSYRCVRRDDGWLITCVLTSPLGVALHQTAVSSPPGPGQDADGLATAARLLDRLAADLDGAHGRSDGETPPLSPQEHLPLDDPTWLELGAALLPAYLDDHLRQSAGTAAAALLIVPDGPLCLVPFGGLRMPDGAPLGERAAVALVPSLGILSDGSTRSEPSGSTTVVTHCGPTVLAARFTEAASRSGVHVVDTADRAALIAALRDKSGVDMVVVSHHGELGGAPADHFIHLKDGLTLSAVTAAGLPWPATVILGSCWSANLRVQAGEEPFALSTACLLGGATHVIGGLAPVDQDKGTAAILTDVAMAALHGVHPAEALRSAVLGYRSRKPRHAWPPPSQWATLAVWTTVAPQTPSTPAMGTADDGDDDDRPAAAASGVPSLTDVSPEPLETVGLNVLPASSATLRVLACAAGRHRRDHLDTLDLLAAVVTVDDADWPAFLVGVGTGPPTWEDGDVGDDVVRLHSALGDRVVVHRTVGVVIEVAEAIALRLGDPAVAPAHLVYAMVVMAQSSAHRFLARNSEARVADLLCLLSDRVFGVDLPEPRDVPARPDRGTSDRPLTWGPLLMPAFDARVRTAVRVAAGTGAAPAGTLDLLGAVVAVEPQLAATLGLPAVPRGSESERRYGGVERVLGDRLRVIVTAEFGAALDLSRSLAYRLRHSAVRLPHLLYALVTVEDNDVRRWLDTVGGAVRADPVDLLSRAVFRRPLPPPAGLRPCPTRLTAGGVARSARRRVGRLLVTGARRYVGLQVTLLVLAVLALSVNLRPVYDSRPSGEHLLADVDLVTATAVVDGATRPAVLVGGLGEVYPHPAVYGLNNLSGAALREDPPGELDRRYLFVVSTTTPGATVKGTASLTYRGRTVDGDLTCAGRFADYGCFIVARLPKETVPGGFRWAGFEPVAGTTEMAAYVLSGRRDVHPATVRQEARTADGEPGSVVVRDNVTADGTMQVTPVVYRADTHDLPLLGVAFGASADGWRQVIDLGVLRAYASGFASRYGGAVPGTRAYIGVRASWVSSDAVSPAGFVVSPQIGGAADIAGVRPGDRIVAFDGRTALPGDNLAALVQTRDPGERVEMLLDRRGMAVTVSVVLDYQPAG